MDSNTTLMTDNSLQDIIEKLLYFQCTTWHPDFANKYRDQIINTIHTKVPFEDVNNDNKWGYQYHISENLKKIPIDYNNILSVKNMIIMDYFVIRTNSKKEIKYSTINPVSVYEVFYHSH